jgi:conjugal transfer ATP-binding protein TraC
MGIITLKKFFVKQKNKVIAGFDLTTLKKISFSDKINRNKFLLVEKKLKQKQMNTDQTQTQNQSSAGIIEPIVAGNETKTDQEEKSSKKIFSKQDNADKKETPEWLKESEQQVRSEKDALPSFRDKKPSKAELGIDPSSWVEAKPSEEVIRKATESATEEMKKAGYDPSTGKKIEENTATTQSQPKQEVNQKQESAQKSPQNPEQKKEKKSILENLKSLFAFSKKEHEETVVKIDESAGKPKQEQKSSITEEEKKKYIEAEKIYQEGLASIKDLIAPASMDIEYEKIRIDGVYAQSFYVFSYPRYLDANWLAPLINFDVTMDISQFIYPISSDQIMRTLKKKVAQMQSSMRINAEKGQVRDPGLETALEDAESLRTEIQRGQEKFFQFALYFTIYAEDEKKLQKVAKQLESLLAGKLVMTKKAQLQAEHALNSTLPICLDELYTIRNMNTGPLSTTFPFTSSDLSSDKGILYGINRHNDSLIIFDRFALENANSVVFAKSGAGKSYAVKLEMLRLMMMGTDVIVIDPENEYESLSNMVGGTYLKLSLNSDRRINPFDLPTPIEGDDIQAGDLLRSSVINLHGLLKLMLGNLNAEEESVLDKALLDVYALKGITMETVDPSAYEPPTMEDLYQILSSMEGAESLTQRLSKYTQGSYSGIFNKPTNIDLSSGMMVFCIRDLEDALRPIAMYIILNYIWNKVRSKLKKRIMVIDEAWSMMQHEDSAKFLYGLVKRARKYYLGVTTITQDVEDFIKSDYGRPIITNSSMQLLLKQAPSAVDVLAKIFNLTEGEKYVLINSGVGQGLFFAGLKHVATQIVASYTEDQIVTTNPEEILKARDEMEKKE